MTDEEVIHMWNDFGHDARAMSQQLGITVTTLYTRLQRIRVSQEPKSERPEITARQRVRQRINQSGESL